MRTESASPDQPTDARAVGGPSGYGLVATRFRGALLMMAVTALLSGCEQPVGLAATEVLNNTNCKGAESGLKKIDYAGVAALRGSTLLTMTPPTQASGPELILLSLSNGRQPTPGYQYQLRDAFLDGNVAVLDVLWETPDRDSVQAQVVTYPCMVVGLENGPFNKVRVVGADGETIDELRI